MVKKVIMGVEPFKVSSTDYILKVVLKNCEPKVLYMLADLFGMCLNEYLFLDCWKASFAAPIFKNVKEKSVAKNYHTVSLISMASKIFEKPVNTINRLHKCGLFSDFQ